MGESHARVRAVDLLTGALGTVAGTGLVGSSGDGGPATLAYLTAPAGLAVDPTTAWLYIADRDSGRVRMADLDTQAPRPRLRPPRR